MLGSIIGDTVGSIYEFHNIKTTKFPLFSKRSIYTDDSIMTIAVAEGLLKAGLDAPLDEIRREVTASMQKWGRKYPNPMGDYGPRFWKWLNCDHPQPNRSWGNGSAMRVAAVGWLYPTLERTLEVAEATADVSHNDPEGVKGAQATAAAIFLARTGHTIQAIQDYIESTFEYDLSRTCDEIRPYYEFDDSCQGTVPEALTVAFEGRDFEEVIRLAVSLGGDSDTLTCIAGGVAEALYPIPQEILDETLKRLPADLRSVVDLFVSRKNARRSER